MLGNILRILEVLNIFGHTWVHVFSNLLKYRLSQDRAMAELSPEPGDLGGEVAESQCGDDVRLSTVLGRGRLTEAAP